MPIGRLSAYAAEVRALQVAFGDRLNLWLGAELDYIPSKTVATFQERSLVHDQFDYFVGSVHFLGDGDGYELDGTKAGFDAILAGEYGGNISAMVSDYYKRVAAVPFLPRVAVIGHFDLIKRWNAGRSYFTGEEDWYRRAVEQALGVIARSDVMVELNTAGWRKGLGEPYPAPWILKRCRDLQIPVTVSADAHKPDQLTWGYERAAELLLELEIAPVNPATLIRRRQEV